MLNLNGLIKISKNIMPAILAGMSLLSACDSVIYDGEGDCSYRNGIRFVYDWNMKRADAFPSEVKAVRVWAFGQDGTLAAVYADAPRYRLIRLAREKVRRAGSSPVFST